MPPVTPYRRKTKRRTTYNERYNALSALDVQTRDLIQGLWAQSAIKLKNAQSLLVLCFVTNNFQLMGNCLVLPMLVNYMNALDQCQFLESLDAEFTGATPTVSPVPGFSTATASTAVDNGDAIEIDVDGDENIPPKKMARQWLSKGDAKDLIREFQNKDRLAGAEILGFLSQSVAYNNEMLRIAKADEERKQQAEERKRKADDRDHYFHLWNMKEKGAITQQAFDQMKPDGF